MPRRKKSSDIFEFPEVRVVEASAGSGKTYALAKRYVQLLLSPDRARPALIRDILAITFTNKAAFEMKERILKLLKGIALKSMTPDDLREILAPIHLSEAAARPAAFSIMEQVIHQYNFFQVQTIDSFIKTLLVGCAFETGLTAGFKIKTTSAEYLEYALDELIDGAQQKQELQKILAEFLHHYLYLENRTGWFPKKDILAILQSLFTQYNYYGAEYVMAAGRLPDLLKQKRAVLKNMQALAGQLPAGTHSRFVQSLDGFLKENAAGFDVDRLSAYFENEDFPIKSGAELPRAVERLWDRIRAGLRKVCEQEAYSLFDPYVAIFQQVMAEFRRLSVKDDVLFLEELNRRAGLLLANERITIGELYYRLATRFIHYLLDEFQDTSRLQWHNIEPFVSEALSTGGSLFYVGDRKQAIYGFRGGDAGLFDEIQDRFVDYPIRPEALRKNWRSEKAIVEFNNAVFSPENLEAFVERREEFERQQKKKNGVVMAPEDRRMIGQAFAHSQQVYRPENQAGYVCVERIDIDKKEERDEAVRTRLIPLIRELRERFSYADIAILSRTQREVEQVTGWLLTEDIFVESERTSDIKMNPLIQELIAFFKFLDSPIDNLSFAQFILGDCFGAATGMKARQRHDFVFGRRDRLKNEKDFYLYTAFRERFPDVWERWIDEFFKNVGLYPLYELTVSLYHRLDCLKNFPDSQGFLMRFLELIKEEEDEHSDVAAFLEYFEQLEGEALYVHVTDTDAVKVLTIHKAKGLEFPAVILPFLSMDIQVGQGGGDQQQSYVLQKEDGAMRLLRLKNKYCAHSGTLREIYAAQYKKAFLAELNNVYVALTRPKKELYVFVSNKSGGNHNLARFLIPENLRECGKKAGYPVLPEAASGTSWKLPVTQYHDWLDYLRDEFAPFDQLKNRRQRLKGTVIHAILSQIGNLNHGSKEDIVAAALAEAGRQFSLAGRLSDYQAVVNGLVERPFLKPFMYIDDGEVATEKDVVNSAGHTKRMDRLIAKKDEIWVVDFKTGAERQDHYEAQIREYMGILKELHPRQRVKGYLIFLDKEEVREFN